MERPRTLSTAQRVRIRGRRWTVQSLTRYEDCEAVHVTSGDRGARGTFLRPFDRVEPFEAPVRIPLLGLAGIGPEVTLTLAGSAAARS